MKISIVIPVYNEGEALEACLEAISRQVLQPFEVIVVDNNSTDDTAFVARSYPFVTLLAEPRQGVSHARNRGFNAATGDIIGRIDADTILPEDWTATLAGIFIDKSISAVSGSAHYYDFALAGVADRFDGYFRNYLALKLKQDNFLWGANMGVRRSAWRQIRRHLCSQRYMHEDFDLGIHLQEHGYRVAYSAELRAGVSSRRIDTGWLDYLRYTLRSPQTYARHNLSSQRHMYPVIAACWLAYLPGRLIYRGYNPASQSFSLSQLLSGTTARVDPTSNVA